MNTHEIMRLALQMANMSEMPTDSGVWHAGEDISNVLFGIDIGAPELEIARRLGYDLVIGHHPPEATLEAWRMYLIHVEQMVGAGVPRELAEKAVAADIEMMQWRAHGRNDRHTVSVAELIGMPYMNVHLPLDEIGRKILQDHVDGFVDSHPRCTVGDVLKSLDELAEVQNARVPPRLAFGDPEAPARRVIFSHGALDIPNGAIIEAYYAYGVDVIITLRAPLVDLKRLQEEANGALIVIGHMAGDSLGITPFLAALEERGLHITRISGVVEP